MPTNDSSDRLDLAVLDRQEREDFTRWGTVIVSASQLRLTLDLVDRMGEVLERALTTTERIERAIHRRHFNPGTLQKMADAVDDYRRAKGEHVESRPPF